MANACVQLKVKVAYDICSKQVEPRAAILRGRSVVGKLDEIYLARFVGNRGRTDVVVLKQQGEGHI